MYKGLLFIIVLVSFLKQLVFVALVPLWHFPDEQAHFGQVAYIAETGKNVPWKEDNLTEEIRKSEELLGTERDELGINKFTYHPEYRIEYTDTYQGKHEAEIDSLASDMSLRQMTKIESTGYSPLYYKFLSFSYLALYNQSLILRVFAVRAIQTLFSIGTVIGAFLISRKLFKNRLLIYALPLLISFQPMFSFVSSGVNSDNIANFVFSVYIFSVFLLLEKGNLWPKVFFWIAVSFLTIYVKPQFSIIIFSNIAVLTYLVFGYIEGKLWQKISILLLFLGFFSLTSYALLVFNIAPVAVFVRSVSSLSRVGEFFSYLTSYALPHAYREVLPWYWGVFDWLGVTYPRIVHRIVNWSIVASLIGFLFWIKRAISGKEENAIQVSFLIVVSLLLFFGIYFYDWLEFSQREIHLGVQGRYFFPTISAHITIYLIGLNSLFEILFRSKKTLAIKGVVLGFVLFNFFALYTISKTYYDIGSIGTYVTQVSQYKPFFLKGWYLYILFGLYILLTLYLIYLYVFIRSFKDKDT